MVDVFFNFLVTTLAQDVASTATEFPVDGTTGWPEVVAATDTLLCSVLDGSKAEIVKVTGSTQTTLTVVRAQEGTTAQDFTAGADIKHAVTAGMLGRLAGARKTANVEFGAVASGVSSTGVIEMAKGYRLLALTVDTACRVRLYTTTAKRDADASRAVGTAASDNAGLMFEFVATGAGTHELSPVVDGFQNEAPPGVAVPISVSHSDPSPKSVSVTFTYIRTES